MEKHFYINKLIAWSPQPKSIELGLEDFTNENLKWIQSDFFLPENIPKNHARRMSFQSKLAVSLAIEASCNFEVDHAVFASRYGELLNTVGLIKMLCNDEELSPTKFSQSVYNTGSGLFSIITKASASTETISSGANSFMSGLVSALSYVFTNVKDKVLFVYSDDRVPEPLYSHADSYDREKIGIAMILSACGEGVKASLDCKSIRKSNQRLTTSQSHLFLQRLFSEEKKEIVIKDF